MAAVGGGGGVFGIRVGVGSFGFWVPDLTCSAAAAVAPTVAAAAAAAVAVRAQIINLTNCPDDWQTKAAATAATTDLHSSLVSVSPSPCSL